MKLILASKSPRRKELLTQLGYSYECISSQKEEVLSSAGPQKVVKELSKQKAEEVWNLVKERQDGDIIVLGADTIVEQDGEILGKPKDRQDAENMLTRLQGNNHRVWTGVTLAGRMKGQEVNRTFVEETKVFMYPVSEEEIKEYVATGEPDDKAGAYAIQGLGAKFIERIEGDYNNVVGLPAARVYQELQKLNRLSQEKEEIVQKEPVQKEEETEKKKSIQKEEKTIQKEPVQKEEKTEQTRKQAAPVAEVEEDMLPDVVWYDKAVFYHIYPLGLCGSAHENTGVAERHFDKLNEWAMHAKKIGCTAIYIGPLFESVGHGYETTDYKLVDRRLGTNDDFKEFVKNCHNHSIKVVVDGVFNHTGREFFAFKDIRENRERSKYKDWYCNVNFWGNNEYNDGFSYENWGGYNLLAKLNVWNPEVKNYLFDVVRFWISEFDIDGIRLDAADVLDMGFMSELKHVVDAEKKDFWLMGEVIHGDYSRWANSDRLNSVTNYELHKGLYSGHNDHNYFEIAHTINRLNNLTQGIKLYTFVDNHDVARIHSKLTNKEHMYDITMLLYTVPGIPSIYYGSEFAIDGKKENGSDWNLRPSLNLADYEKPEYQELLNLITSLGTLKKKYKELTTGTYEQVILTNRQFVFARKLENSAIIVALNNDDAPAQLNIPAMYGDVTLECLVAPEDAKNPELNGDRIIVNLPANRGMILYVRKKI